MSVALRVKRLTEHAHLPARATASAAGYDLCRCARATRPPARERPAPRRASTSSPPIRAHVPPRSAYAGVVPARGRALLKTDLAIAVPAGTYGRVAPRSGLALKAGIDTGAGVIDADYRGNVGVILFNHSDTDFAVAAGDRIAQLILEAIVTPPVAAVDELDDTDRGAGGFGSTGVSQPADGAAEKKPRVD